jgi:hypothetical protein
MHHEVTPTLLLSGKTNNRPLGHPVSLPSDTGKGKSPQEIVDTTSENAHAESMVPPFVTTACRERCISSFLNLGLVDVYLGCMFDLTGTGEII